MFIIAAVTQFAAFSRIIFPYLVKHTPYTELFKTEVVDLNYIQLVMWPVFVRPGVF
jgi:hypothetical protein